MLLNATAPKFKFQEPIFRPLPSPNRVQTVKPWIAISSYGYLAVLNCNRVRSLRTQSVQMVSGEFPTILGTMFAGKATTVLKRIQSDRSKSSFQANDLKNLFCLDETIKDLCFSGRVMEAVGILCRTGVQVESETYSLLLQECDLDTAHIIFDRLKYKCLVSWNAMVAGYVQKGMEEVGLSLFYNLKQSGLNPDQYTFSSVFRACASLAILEQGRQAHAMMIKCQISRNIVVNSALMDMYFKCSSPYDGYLVFEKSLERNVITWTALISGLGQHGRVVEVLEFFNRMISEGFRPNTVTFLAVLSACSHGGFVDKGKEYFSSMSRDYGLQPSGKHYAAIVDLLGRAGRLEEAYEFVKNSPCKEHSVLWGALLGACKVHGNMDMVKIAARNYFELEPENAGKYVVLSNAYASFGMWNNVAEIRRVMKESGVKKEPGYSMIEVQRQAHFFSMGHNTHTQTDFIYEVVRDLTCILRDTGDVLELSS
nr:pentatricopeptide repeat-containing protein At4g16470-like isoform X1 [Ipomoea batatas]GMD41472.1 pentatricopeptide repeat-containing protein At4g16470-like isoform X1 [Ipomoea batatas]GME15731.1 pentatricopeptide repeat-containing protein At4g16470-like isoform X1 [Ipomoea batatas]